MSNLLRSALSVLKQTKPDSNSLFRALDHLVLSKEASAEHWSLFQHKLSEAKINLEQLRVVLGLFQKLKVPLQTEFKEHTKSLILSPNCFQDPKILSDYLLLSKDFSVLEAFSMHPTILRQNLLRVYLESNEESVLSQIDTIFTQETTEPKLCIQHFVLACKKQSQSIRQIYAKYLNSLPPECHAKLIYQACKHQLLTQDNLWEAENLVEKNLDKYTSSDLVYLLDVLAWKQSVNLPLIKRISETALSCSNEIGSSELTLLVHGLSKLAPSYVKYLVPQIRNNLKTLLAQKEYHKLGVLCFSLVRSQQLTPEFIQKDLEPVLLAAKPYLKTKYVNYMSKFFWTRPEMCSQNFLEQFLSKWHK